MLPIDFSSMLCVSSKDEKSFAEILLQIETILNEINVHTNKYHVTKTFCAKFLIQRIKRVTPHSLQLHYYN